MSLLGRSPLRDNTYTGSWTTQVERSVAVGGILRTCVDGRPQLTTIGRPPHGEGANGLVFHGVVQGDCHITYMPNVVYGYPGWDLQYPTDDPTFHCEFAGGIAIEGIHCDSTQLWSAIEFHVDGLEHWATDAAREGLRDRVLQTLTEPLEHLREQAPAQQISTQVAGLDSAHTCAPPYERQPHTLRTASFKGTQVDLIYSNRSLRFRVTPEERTTLAGLIEDYVKPLVALLRFSSMQYLELGECHVLYEGVRFECFGVDGGRVAASEPISPEYWLLWADHDLGAEDGETLPYEDLVPRWLGLFHRAERPLMALIRLGDPRNVLAEHRLLDAATSIEGLSRSMRAQESRYRDGLRWAWSQVANMVAVWGISMDDWERELVKFRNIYAHADTTGERVDPEMMAEVEQATRVVATALVMRHLGFLDEDDMLINTPLYAHMPAHRPAQIFTSPGPGLGW